LLSSSMAMPADRNQSWSAWINELTEDISENLDDPFYDAKDQVMDGWQYVQEFLPGKIIKYVEETADDGQKLAKEIYDETRQSIVEKTSGHVDDITDMVSDFISKLVDIKDNAVEIVSQKQPLSEQQIEARNQQEDLQGTKQKLKQLKQEIEKNKADDKEYEGLEGMIQRLITSARGLLDETNTQTELFWSKVKQMEVEMYRVENILAETSGNLKDVLKELFATLNKELKEASPALKEILDKAEKEARQG